MTATTFHQATERVSMFAFRIRRVTIKVAVLGAFAYGRVVPGHDED